MGTIFSMINPFATKRTETVGVTVGDRSQGWHDAQRNILCG